MEAGFQALRSSWAGRPQGPAQRAPWWPGREPVWRRQLGAGWYPFPMKATIDAVGRVVVPKPLRDSLGLRPGSEVDISRYGEGLTLVPVSRSARLVDEGGVSVVTGKTKIDDETVFGLIDQGRR